MKQITRDYLTRLRNMYASYDDQESLMALSEAESFDERARTLAIYREQDKTQELIHAILERFKQCVIKLSNYEEAKKMTDEDRSYCYASMDWCLFTLDIIGETPESASAQVDELVAGYARKAGIIPN